MITVLQQLYRPFLCPGCRGPSFQSICKTCFELMKRNTGQLFPMEEGILGLFPIFISFSTTHGILKYWKTNGGSRLQTILFDAHPELIRELQSLNLEAVISIPQDPQRSLKAGHASAFQTGIYFSKLLGIPVLESILKLKPGMNGKQAERSEWDRRYSPNPFDGNGVMNPMKQKRILLVDDFVTSGSTLSKASMVLNEHYAGLQIYAACLGWKPRTGLPRQGLFRSIESDPVRFRNP